MKKSISCVLSGSCLAIFSLVSAANAQTIIVERGDTLWGLAVTYLGDGSRWPELCDLNARSLGNCNQLGTGQVLQLPTGTSVTNEDNLEQSVNADDPASTSTQNGIETGPEASATESETRRAPGVDMPQDDASWHPNAVQAGLEVERLTAGPSDGGAFAEYRVSGTSTGGGVYAFYRSSLSRMPVFEGEVLTASAEIELLDGTLPQNVSFGVRIVEFEANTFSGLDAAVYDPDGAVAQSLSTTRTFEQSENRTAELSLAMVGIDAGQVIDVTFRVVGLNLESFE